MFARFENYQRGRHCFLLAVVRTPLRTLDFFCEYAKNRK